MVVGTVNWFKKLDLFGIGFLRGRGLIGVAELIYLLVEVSFICLNLMSVLEKARGVAFNFRWR